MSCCGLGNFALRGEVAGFTCCLGVVAPDCGSHPHSTAATYVVLGELPSQNLSSVTCLQGFLGLHEILWVQCPGQGLQSIVPHLWLHQLEKLMSRKAYGPQTCLEDYCAVQQSLTQLLKITFNHFL